MKCATKVVKDLIEEEVSNRWVGATLDKCIRKTHLYKEVAFELRLKTWGESALEPPEEAHCSQKETEEHHRGAFVTTVSGGSKGERIVWVRLQVSKDYLLNHYSSNVFNGPGSMLFPQVYNSEQNRQNRLLPGSLHSRVDRVIRCSVRHIKGFGF